MVKINKTAVVKAGVVTVAALLAAGGVVITSQHYEKYQTKQTQEAAVAAEQEAKEDQQAQATEAKLSKVLVQYEQTRLECEKNKGTYARLTAFQRQSVSPPGNCGPAVIN